MANRGTEALTGAKNLGRKLTKGMLLVLWIGMLAFLAIWAARGKASSDIASFIDSLTRPSFFMATTRMEYPEVVLVTEQLILDLENPPPLRTLLDELAPNWDTIKIVDDKLRLSYQGVFTRLRTRLFAIADDTDIDPSIYDMEFSIIPSSFWTTVELNNPFENGSPSNGVGLPVEVRTWIKEERVRKEATSTRGSLIDTFLLLIVLGAFGSLIFLIRDYIMSEAESPFSAYIFRPVLGMFLAMAIFVIDILAHAVVSDADILQVRRETLYVLALAAGLLADQAYIAVSSRAQKVLAGFQPQPADQDQGNEKPDDEGRG